MNGVLHSEHVISRSGIAVSPREVKRGFHSLALRSAGVAFLSTTNVWGESAVFSNARRKAGVPTVNWPECTPAMHSIQIFCVKSVAGDLHPSSGHVARVQHLTSENLVF